MLSQNGSTALILASWEGHESTASALIAAGASVDIQENVSTHIIQVENIKQNNSFSCLALDSNKYMLAFI